MKKRFFVGIDKLGNRILFSSSVQPSINSHGDQFIGVIGPFRTKRGAIFMRDYGKMNPHCRTVADAERLAISEKQVTSLLEAIGR